MLYLPKSTLLALFVLTALSLPSTMSFSETRGVSTQRSNEIMMMAAQRGQYIPSGFTEAQWMVFQQKENQKNKGNLGLVGPRGFKSRSFQSYHEAMEKGETDHLFPVLNFRQKVKKGELKMDQVPYMQRGGAWDNSDVKGAKKKRWLNSDKAYAAGGYKKYQTVSVIGWPPAKFQGLDWTGNRGKK